VPKKTGRRPQRDEQPCKSGTENTSRPEDASSRDSGTTHERHLQAEHEPPCKSGTATRNRQKELGHGKRTERTVTGQRSGRRRQPQQKCNEGMRNQDAGELLRLRKKRTRMFGGLRRNSTLLRYQRPPEQQTMDWTLRRGRPPPKKKNGKRKTARMG
jgi:hypothetical protein